ncbi:MAG: MMPL family transporter [Thermoanaerobaculia bacterium]
MRALSQAAISHPLRTLGVALLATLAAAPGLLHLELRTDGHALVPPNDPAVVYDRQVRAVFGVRDPIAVVVRSPDPAGIFNAATLRRVRGLADDLARLDGVGREQVLSLATVPGFRLATGSLRVRPLLDPLAQTPPAIAELRGDLNLLRAYDGTLVGRGGRATALYVGTPPGADRAAFYRRVRRIAATYAGGGDRIEVLGAPVAESLLGSHILADLGIPPALLGDPDATLLLGGSRAGGIGLLPLTLGVIALVFLFAFRHPVAVLLPVAMIACCLVLVFGLMGWLGIPVYLTTVVLPVLLAAACGSAQVYIFRWYGRLRRERPGESPAALVSETLDDMASPVIQAGATAAVGFLSFAFSPLGPVRAFGLFAALGITACLAWSLTVAPAVLVLLRPAIGGRVATKGEALFRGCARFAIRHRRAVLAVALLLAVGAADGVRRVIVQDSWLDGFAPASGFAREMRNFDRDFAGTHALQVMVAAEPVSFAATVGGGAIAERALTLPMPALPAGFPPERLAGASVELHRLTVAPPGALVLPDWSAWVATARRDGDRLVLDLPPQGGSPQLWFQPHREDSFACQVHLEPLLAPAVLARIGRFEAFLASRPGVGGTAGPASTLETVGVALAPDQPGSRRLPATPVRARSAWSSYEHAAGPAALRRLVDPAFSRGLVTAWLKGSNYVDTGRLMADLRDYERRELAPHGLRLGFAGDVAVSQALIRAVVTTQVQSLVLSVAGILAVMALLGGSWRRGLLGVVPPALAVLLDFAAMGWLGVPLGVATAMFSALAMGIGIDSAIQLLERNERLRAAGHPEPLVEALAVTGPAMAIDTLSVALGFAVLLLSNVPATARLGGLISLALLTCLTATLTVVPALLATARPAAATGLAPDLSAHTSRR